MKSIGLAWLCISVVCSVFGQTKKTVSVQQVWLGVLNQTRLSDRWGLWADVHLRTRSRFFNNFSQSVLRGGVTYYFSDAVRFTAGYAYFSFYADGKRLITQPEHRPWQQLQWHTKYKRMQSNQRIRLEERYRRKFLNDSTLGNGYNFNFRLRYNFMLQVPFSNKQNLSNTFSFIANNEVMVNFGKEIVYNYFDQNRFFIGLGYQTSPTDLIQAGYMNIFQQLPSGNEYRSVHAIRIFYFTNIDLRKRK